MKRIFAAAVLAFAVSCNAAQPAVMTVAGPIYKNYTWGVEYWLPGSGDFYVQFNEPAGSKIGITGIDGAVTGAGTPGSNLSNNALVRQTLVAIYDPFTGSPDVTEWAGPVLAANHGVSDHLLNVNVKQAGLTATTVPVNMHFDSPYMLKSNRLAMRIDQFSQVCPCSASQVMNDQLDTEVQIIVHYVVYPPNMTVPK